MTSGKRVLLLLADGFELLEAAGFTDVLGWANLDGDTPIEVVSAGLRSPLKTTFGFGAVPDVLAAELDLEAFDALAIPGGFEGAGFYQDAYDTAFKQIVSHFAHAEKLVGAVCVASLAVAATGVLSGRRATVYHQIGGKRRAELEGFGGSFIDEAIVEDGKIITSTGPGTAIEVAFRFLAHLTSEENAAHVRQLMRTPPLDRDWLHTPQVTTAMEVSHD